MKSSAYATVTPHPPLSTPRNKYKLEPSPITKSRLTSRRGEPVVRAPHISPAPSRHAAPSGSAIAPTQPSAELVVTAHKLLSDTELIDAMSTRDIQALLSHYGVNMQPQPIDAALLGAVSLDAFDDATQELQHIEVRYFFRIVHFMQLIPQENCLISRWHWGLRVARPPSPRSTLPCLRFTVHA